MQPNIDIEFFDDTVAVRLDNCTGDNLVGVIEALVDVLAKSNNMSVNDVYLLLMKEEE